MVTTLSVRTDLAAAQRGLKQLSRDLEGIGTTATAMGRDSDRAVDQLSESLDTAEKQAVETAEAVQGIGDKEAVSALDSIKAAVKDLTSQQSNATSASGAAKKATQELEAQNRRTGEATKQLTETLYDLTRGLGSGGVVGGVQAALPKLTGLVNFLGGPWGAALTVSAGLLATLITGLMDSAEAEKEAEAATKRHLEAMEAYIQKLKERLEWEQKLKGADSQSAAQTVENLNDQIAIQEQMTDQIVKDREERESRLGTLKKEIQEAQKDLPVPGKGLITIHDKETRSLIARLKKEQQELEAANAESHRQQVERLQEIAGLRTKLSAAQQVAERKQKEEAARKHQEELKQIEEKRKAEEERSEAERQRAQQQLDKELDRETADPFADSLRQINETEAQRKKFVESLNLTLEEKAQRIEQIEKSANEQRKAIEDAALQARVNADKKAAEEQQQRERQKREQEQKQQQQADERQKQLTEQQGKQAKAIADEIRNQANSQDARPDREETRDLARTLAEQRTAEAEKLAQEELAKRNAERRKNSPDLLSGQAGVNREIAADERATQERLRRQRAAAERQAMQDLQSGKVSPEEVVNAQQQAIQASLKTAQATGQLSANAVQVLGQTTAELANLNQEVSALQEQLLLVQRQLRTTKSSGQRRRAQMGGGR